MHGDTCRFSILPHSLPASVCRIYSPSPNTREKGPSASLSSHQSHHTHKADKADTYLISSCHIPPNHFIMTAQVPCQRA